MSGNQRGGSRGRGGTGMYLGGLRGRKRRDKAVADEAYRSRDNGRGFIACDACGWRLPSCLRGYGRRFGLEGHHVIPMHAGGADVAENIAILCATHHRVAHAVRSRPRRAGLAKAPATVAELVAALRDLDAIGRGEAAEEDARAPGSQSLITGRDPAEPLVHWRYRRAGHQWTDGSGLVPPPKVKRRGWHVLRHKNQGPSEWRRHVGAQTNPNDD